MASEFVLELLKEDGSIYSLKIESIDTNLGKAWGNLLSESIDSDTQIDEPHRIYSLNDNWGFNEISSEIKKCVDVVNSYKEGTIEYKDNLNYLHKYFEDFMQPNNEFYMSAPTNVREAIHEFNILIHRYEHKANVDQGKIVVSLTERPIRNMTIEEANEFDLELSPGDVTLKYCHKGKKIFDIFTDDEMDNRHVGDNNIKPQTCISSDFKIYFSDPIGGDIRNEFYDWLVTNDDFFLDIGIDLEDPMNTIGFGKVGRVVGDIDTIKKEIYGVTKIHNVRYN